MPRAGTDPAPSCPHSRETPYTMTTRAVLGRDAVATDRAPDPPRLSRGWLRRVVADFRRERARFGLRSTLREFAFRAIHHVVSFRVLRGMYLGTANGRFTECPPGFTGAFLTRETLQRVSLDRRYDMRSEEHTSELRHVEISYAVFCLKKKRE